MLRITLKTSDKAEAKRRAAALEMELEMVAVTLPQRSQAPSPEQLCHAYKQALEFKRDQIISIQSRPPFDDEAHRLSNWASSKIFGQIARSGSEPSRKGAWEEFLGDPTLSDKERAVLTELCSRHGLQTSNEAEWDWLIENCDSDDKVVDGGFRAPLGRPPIAPHFVLHFLENAGITDTAVNRRVGLAVAAAAYSQACLEANESLGETTEAGTRAALPETLRRLLDPEAKNSMFSPIQRCDQANGEQQAGCSAGPERPSVLMSPSPAPEMTSEGLIDLKVSELCKLAVAENERSGDWQDSARRNAKVIADIFIEQNGDLPMSEIDRSHLLALDARLKILPTIWGKGREDRQGGLRAVFDRGEKLAAEWKRDPIAAEQNGIPKVGLSPATYNRHINTLKQVFGFARDLEDGNGKQTHISPKVSFHKLRQKDKRKKNKRKPVPVEEELRTLVSGPIFTGCSTLENRSTPGSLIFHDGGYWVPLFLVVYGPRSNEVCQMPLTNVVENAPIPFFRIRSSLNQDTKTAATDRDLPIAPKLIELGFLDYVRALKALGEYWLFPEFNTTKVPARKRFREEIFVPLLQHHFPAGTSSILDGKEIDTQSLRKFGMTYLRKATPKIELGIRQTFFGHERPTTMEGTYEDDPTIDELLPCVERMQSLIDHVQPFPLRLRSD